MGAESKGDASGIRKYAVTRKDIPAVIISCASFMGNIGVGGCVGSLGPAIPVLAVLTGSSEAALGMLFTMRGLGYFAGTAVTTAVMHVETIALPKDMILILSCLCVSLGMGLLTWTLSPHVLMLASFLQGVGCGGMDLGTNCIVADVWGDRIQPWMQALHACFGIGALVGPALVGLLGYALGFQIMALLLVGGAVVAAFKQCIADSCGSDLSGESDAAAQITAIEMTGSAVRNPVHAAVATNGMQPSNAGDETYDGIAEQVLAAARALKDVPIESSAAADSVSVDAGSDKAQAVTKVPMFVQVLCVMFFFVYVGIETGFGGWVPTFSLKVGIAADESAAAYLTAVFYGSLAVGRIVSVPASMFLSSTSMVRIQLLVSLMGGVAFFFLGQSSYALAYVSCSVFGAGLSALFPLMLVLPIDYGLTMDDATTSRFIIGGTIGEAVLPVVIGHTMSYFGPVALLYDTLVIAVTMMVLYVTSHCYLVRRRIEASGADYLGAYATLPISEEEKTQDLSV